MIGDLRLWRAGSGGVEEVGDSKVLELCWERVGEVGVGAGEVGDLRVEGPRGGAEDVGERVSNRPSISERSAFNFGQESPDC